MMHSILIIGQSNMGGRGALTEAREMDTSRIFVLRNGRWRPMYRPVNPDRITSGVNLAESFAERYASEHEVDVGIIPCADGGTSLDQWVPGGLLFDHACYMAELASRTSTIAAVLWHQGESDTDPSRFPLYREKFTRIMNEFRRKLDLYDVPFILGGLGEFLSDFPTGKFGTYTEINKTLEDMARELPYVGYATSAGLEDKGDKMHFCADALYEFGLRYYDAFKPLENKNKVFVEKSTMDSAIRNEIESL